MNYRDLLELKRYHLTRSDFVMQGDFQRLGVVREPQVHSLFNVVKHCRHPRPPDHQIRLPPLC